MAIREVAKTHTHTHTQSLWEKNRQLARFTPTIKNKNKNKNHAVVELSRAAFMMDGR